VDAGLQPERTRLAWSRTALTFVANGALLTHAGHAEGAWPWMIPGACVAMCGGVVYGLGTLRHRQTDLAVRTGRPAAGGPVIAVAAALAVLASTAAMILALARI
jgi:uncharacterized membrane protein YidH (DUF202 family)